MFFLITFISFLSPWNFPVGGGNSTKIKKKGSWLWFRKTARDGLEEQRRRKEEAATAAPLGHTRVGPHRGEWREMTVTPCGSCDNCGFLLLFSVLLNVSVGKQAYRRRRGQQGGGGECGKQGRGLIGWKSADSREEREREGPGFHQMQDLCRASPNRVSTQGVLFHPLNECEERNLGLQSAAENPTSRAKWELFFS